MSPLLAALIAARGEPALLAALATIAGAAPPHAAVHPDALIAAAAPLVRAAGESGWTPAVARAFEAALAAARAARDMGVLPDI